MEGKRPKGKQKIDLEKIENEMKRYVCFSKRKSGIYKKANELSILCGVEAGVAVFSPTGKLCSFVSPSVDAIANRLIDQSPPEGDHNHPLVKAFNQSRMDELIMKHSELTLQLNAEKDIEKEMKTSKNDDVGWWEIPMEQLGSEQAKSMEASLIKLHESISDHLKEKNGGSSYSTGVFATIPFGASGSGGCGGCGAASPTFSAKGP